jgi:hypothetical protein
LDSWQRLRKESRLVRIDWVRVVVARQRLPAHIVGLPWRRGKLTNQQAGASSAGNLCRRVQA